jgi:hypothetical protein
LGKTYDELPFTRQSGRKTLSFWLCSVVLHLARLSTSNPIKSNQRHFELEKFTDKTEKNFRRSRSRTPWQETDHLTYAVDLVMVA